ncbi:MAG: FAD-dependent monooxygenase, partial [Pseudomonadota bacterium]
MKRSHIVVVGAGPVGLSFALAASRLKDVEVTVIERNALTPGAHTCGTFDHRVVALSPQSVDFLGSIGVWDKISPQRLTPIDAMRVFGDADGVTKILPEITFDQGMPLAYIVENRALLAALVEATNKTNIQVIERNTVAMLEKTQPENPGGSTLRITLGSGLVIDANLVVGADGRASHVRKLSGFDVIEKDYASDGVVANSRTEKPHGNIAMQLFSKGGVLA